MFHSDDIKIKRIILRATALAVLVLAAAAMGGCSDDLQGDTAAAGSAQTVGSSTLNASSQVPVTVTSLTEADVTAAVPDGSDVVTADFGEANEGEYLISKGGTYILKGNFDGTVTVDANEGLVNLILDNAYIDSVSGPALRVISASKVIITLAGENTLKDSAGYAVSDEADGCITSDCDITVNGTGSLNISGYHKDAVRCKDRVRILGGTLSVIAKRNGIRANDGILVYGADVNVQSEEDGLVTTKTGKNNKGLIEIVGSKALVITGSYGFNSKSDLLIYESHVTDKSVLGHYIAGNNAVIEEGCLE